MERCHIRSLEVLKGLLGKITPRSVVRAIDVGGGDGRLSQSFLINSYKKVDLFDQCPIAIKKAKAALQGSSSFGYAEQVSMKQFQWKYQYSAIFMVWSAGYISAEDLVIFLRDAKTRLIHDDGRITRKAKPKSFIIVLDNVLPDESESFIDKGQRLRTQK